MNEAAYCRYCGWKVVCLPREILMAKKAKRSCVWVRYCDRTVEKLHTFKSWRGYSGADWAKWWIARVYEPEGGHFLVLPEGQRPGGKRAKTDS